MHTTETIKAKSRNIRPKKLLQESSFITAGVREVANMTVATVCPLIRSKCEQRIVYRS